MFRHQEDSTFSVGIQKLVFQTNLNYSVLNHLDLVSLEPDVIIKKYQDDRDICVRVTFLRLYTQQNSSQAN